MAKSLQVKDDALEVLGDEKLVAELEQARATVKSATPEGALSKAEKNPDDFITAGDSEFQVKEAGAPNHDMMTTAYAALLKYTGDGKEEAIKSLKALYTSEKMTWPADAAEAKPKEEKQPVAESIVTVTHETTARDVTTVEKDKVADAIDAENAKLAAQAIAQANATPTPSADMAVMDSLAKSIQETQSALADAIKALGTRLDVLEKSTPALGEITALATALNNAIEATRTNEAQKVKSALDNHGWLDIVKLYSARSAPDNVVTVDGGVRKGGPQETEPQAVVGGPIAGRFIRT